MLTTATNRHKIITSLFFLIDDKLSIGAQSVTRKTTSFQAWKSVAIGVPVIVYDDNKSYPRLLEGLFSSLIYSTAPPLPGLRPIQHLRNPEILGRFEHTAYRLDWLDSACCVHRPPNVNVNHKSSLWEEEKKATTCDPNRLYARAVVWNSKFYQQLVWTYFGWIIKIESSELR